MAELSFEHSLRQHGFRVTPQRRVILKAIWDNGEHASLAEVLADVQRADPNISPATVYRAVELFIARGLVIATRIGNDTVYEIASDHPHHHLLCRACGMDQKLDHARVRSLMDDIDQEYHFLVETEHLILLGLCAHCRLAAA